MWEGGLREVEVYDEHVNSAASDKDVIVILMNRGKSTGPSFSNY